MNPQLEQARELLSAAQRDRLTLRILLGNPESPLESMLFHAQQALEKGLKAVLVAHGVVFRRTHDLIELLDMGRPMASPCRSPATCCCGWPPMPSSFATWA
jgi:HEPN domain-containing protein